MLVRASFTVVIKITDLIYCTISLSAELLKIKEELIKGFPRIGVCPWLAATSGVSCLGLFSVNLLMFYLHFTLCLCDC